MRIAPNWSTGFLAIVALATAIVGAGCSAFNVEGLNARRVPDFCLAEPRADKEPLNYLMLRQDSPAEYILAAEDTIGIFIEGILGDADQPIPVEAEVLGNHPPAVGYPLVIQVDGTVSLPLLKQNVLLKGLTIPQAQELITKKYIEAQLVQEDAIRILVSLYRPRTHQVLVIREDGGGGLGQSGGGTRIQAQDQTAALERGTGYILDMPQNENDVLRALMETGGLPGIDAKSEVKILRGKYKDAATMVQAKAKAAADTKACELGPLPPNDPNTIIIPTRLNPSEVPSFSEEDIILNDGDVLVVEARERDVFYAGGVLGGGEIPLPRDYDLDVLTAIAVAGGPVGGGFNFGASGNFSSFGTGQSLRGSTISPSEVTIIREMPFENQISIKVNLRRALADPSQRILIKPGDVVVLNYTPLELISNIMLNTFPFNTLFNDLIFNQ